MSTIMTIMCANNVPLLIDKNVDEVIVLFISTSVVAWTISVLVLDIVSIIVKMM